MVTCCSKTVRLPVSFDFRWAGRGENQGWTDVSGGSGRGRQEAEVIPCPVRIIHRFFDENGVGLSIGCAYVHGIDAVEVFLIEAALAEGQLLLGPGLEMFCEDFAGEEGVAGDILGHVEDAPEDERQQGDAGDHGDGDLAGGGALYDEGAVGRGPNLRAHGGHPGSCGGSWEEWEGGEE